MNRSFWLSLAPFTFLILWSGGYVVAKVGLQYSAPMNLLGLRYGLVIIIMGVLVVALRPPMPKTKADWVHLCIVGILIQTVYFGMAYFAFINGVAAGTAALIFSLQPILVALIAPRWSGEHIGWRQWAGLLIALAGTCIVIVSRLGIGPSPFWGFFLAAIALMGITSGTLWEKRFGLSHHPVTANLIGYTAGLIALSPFIIAENNFAIDWTWPFIAALFYLVVGNSVIAVGLLLMMIRAGEVSKVSTLLFLVPPVTAIMAWVLLGESMPPIAWFGMAIAGVGVYLATRR